MLHHPAGDLKKVSLDADPPATAYFGAACTEGGGEKGGEKGGGKGRRRKAAVTNPKEADGKGAVNPEGSNPDPDPDH